MNIANTLGLLGFQLTTSSTESTMIFVNNSTVVRLTDVCEIEQHGDSLPEEVIDEVIQCVVDCGVSPILINMSTTVDTSMQRYKERVIHDAVQLATVFGF